jgi:hypothetical protein
LFSSKFFEDDDDEESEAFFTFIFIIIIIQLRHAFLLSFSLNRMNIPNELLQISDSDDFFDSNYNVVGNRALYMFLLGEISEYFIIDFFFLINFFFFKKIELKEVKVLRMK